MYTNAATAIDAATNAMVTIKVTVDSAGCARGPGGFIGNCGAVGKGFENKDDPCDGVLGLTAGADVVGTGEGSCVCVDEGVRVSAGVAVAVGADVEFWTGLVEGEVCGEVTGEGRFDASMVLLFGDISG